MGQGLKQRLLGAVVLLGLLILLAPALFQGGESHPLVEITQPPLVEAPAVPEYIEILDTPPEVVEVTDSDELASLVQEQTPGNDSEGHLKAWTLQLASFSDQANAKKLEITLKNKGYPAYTKMLRRESGYALYKVYIGPEARTDELIVVKQRLKKELDLSGIVVRFQP